MSNPTHNPATCILSRCDNRPDRYITLPDEKFDPQDVTATCQHHSVDAARQGYDLHEILGTL